MKTTQQYRLDGGGQSECAQPPSTWAFLGFWFSQDPGPPPPQAPSHCPSAPIPQPPPSRRQRAAARWVDRG